MSFFRVFLEDCTTKSKSRIPTLFVSRFSSLVPKAVTLNRASSNRSWTVHIKEEDGRRLCFKRGWDKFVEDNDFKTGQILFFEFDGDSTFNVKVYGISSFFQVLIKDYTAKLRIPTPFVSRFSSLVPKAVTLNRASSNRSWIVDIEEEDDQRLCFNWGWDKFVEDNDLKIGQILFFKFDGDSTFKVRVYGTSACEIELHSQPCINENYCLQQYQNQTTSADDQEIQREKDPIDVDGQNWTIDEEIKKERVDSDDVHGNFDQETSASQKEIAQEQNNEFVAMQPESHHHTEKNGEGKRKRQKLKAFNKGSKSDSKYPSFKIFLQRAYAEKGVMCVPTEFFKQYMMNEKQEVEIETENGVWKVTLLPHMKRSCTFARFSKGWSEFARGNLFKTGETLIFKLVRKGNCPKFIVDRQRYAGVDHLGT